VIGTVGACQTLVFRYQDEDECAETFERAAKRLTASKRFSGGVRQTNQYSMRGRNQELVLINQIGLYIAVVTSQNPDQVRKTAKQLVEKLTSSEAFNGS
jgi:prophage antirepressor-like protein